MISKAEEVFIAAGVEEGFRLDGRRPESYREIKCKTSCFNQGFGSAVVTIGENTVSAVITASLKSGECSSTTLLDFKVAFSPCSGSRLSKRKVIEQKSLFISNSLREAWSAVDLSELNVLKNELFWSIKCDLTVIVTDDTSLLDVSSIAAWAALMDTRLPEVRVLKNKQTQKVRGYDLSDSMESVKMLDFPTKGPIIVNIMRIGSVFLVDEGYGEGLVARVSIGVGVNSQGNVLFVRKSGKGSIAPEGLVMAVDLATNVAQSLLGNLFRDHFASERHFDANKES